MKRALGPILAVVLVMAGCGGGSSPIVRQVFDESRVEVVLHVETTASGSTLVAEFRPTQPDLHLYGLGLPATGIDGAGRPTRADVVDAGWQPVGSPQASVVAADVEIDGFNRPFPIYPEGPVTIRQAVARSAAADPEPGMNVALTFMACSTSGVCFAPVERRVLTVPTGSPPGPSADSTGGSFRALASAGREMPAGWAL